MTRLPFQILSVLLFLIGALPAQAQSWTQYVDQNHCAMTRSSWMAIAQSNPGYGWANMPGGANSATFAEAAAWLDVMRLSLAMGPGQNAPNFQNYCCQVDIWENSQTGQAAITLDGQNPGFGWSYSALNRPVMCCEDAAFAIGSDLLNCVGVPLMSVPGAIAAVAPTGPVIVTGAAVTIPTNPPTVVASATGTGGDGGGNNGGGGNGQKWDAGTYMGCFNDPNNPFDLDGYLLRSGQNTPLFCIQTCAAQGFAYAGVQYSESCLCGNSFGKFGISDHCNMPCTGDSSQICGGINSNSVFATGL